MKRFLSLHRPLVLLLVMALSLAAPPPTRGASCTEILSELEILDAEIQGLFAGIGSATKAAADMYTAAKIFAGGGAVGTIVGTASTEGATFAVSLKCASAATALTALARVLTAVATVQVVGNSVGGLASEASANKMLTDLKAKLSRERALFKELQKCCDGLISAADPAVGEEGSSGGPSSSGGGSVGGPGGNAPGPGGSITVDQPAGVAPEGGGGCEMNAAGMSSSIAAVLAANSIECPLGFTFSCATLEGNKVGGLVPSLSTSNTPAFSLFSSDVQGVTADVNHCGKRFYCHIFCPKNQSGKSECNARASRYSLGR